MHIIIEWNYDNTNSHVTSLSNSLCEYANYAAPFCHNIIILIVEVTVNLTCHQPQVISWCVDLKFVT